MKTADSIEQEVNKIRLAIYEQTKDMKPEQLTDYYAKSMEASAKKYGFTIIANALGKRRSIDNKTISR